MAQIIDIHPHVISPDTTRYPVDPIGGMQSNWSAKHPLTYDQLVADMDRAGVSKAAIVQASTVYGHDNTYVAEAVAAYPDRFTGVFSADILADDAISTIEHWRSRGLTAIRLFTAGTTMQGQADWLNDPKSHQAWDYCAETNLPVCVQMRPQGIALLTEVLTQFPKLRIIVDHFARCRFADGPPYSEAEALWALSSFSGVHLKLTHRALEAAADGQSNHKAFFDHVLTFYPANRIAWGSNYPAVGRPLGDVLTEARDALSHLPDKDQRFIFSETAKSLFPSLA